MSTPSNWVAAGLAAAMLFHAPAATARDRQQVSPLAAWSAEAQASLQRALIEPRPLGRSAEPAGVAEVAFAIGKDGRTTDVTIFHSSGYRLIDRKAVAAVRRIRTRSTAPTEMADGQLAVARIFILPGDRPLEAGGMREMVAQTSAKNGWAAVPRISLSFFSPDQSNWQPSARLPD